ncbi:transglutaminase family protein [Echinicola shivajiensis]|uniref:transglutaminase family protein n=1 Tax=Echinicola shivajiensis TaxID=1035916 RepID=UPI001BFC18C4|nr:transglutaminase family protein [Echinicola shivajiensis]
MNSEYLLNIHHLTQYRYDQEIILNPQKILLTPAMRSYYKVLSYESHINPSPLGINHRMDMEGNLCQHIWFDKPTQLFEIDIKTELKILPVNPFDFILDNGFEGINENGELNFNYSIKEMDFLAPYLKHPQSDLLFNKTKNIKAQATGIVSFLVEITAEIHRSCQHIIRHESGVWSPEKTLAEKKGSCRDLSWLLINMLRSIGLASRFVSGYAYNPELEENHELHAWVEVFCPGAGWIGLDPSLGLLTDAYHIPLAISYIPELTLPISGSYGGQTKSHLKSYVAIKKK